MKKLMLIAAVVIASVSAHASKARLEALQNAAHLDDIQDVFTSKPDSALMYEAATVEFGDTGTAEGGFIRKMGDSAWSFYLGRNSTTYADATSVLTANGGSLATSAAESTALGKAFAQDNSMQLTYAAKAGALSWGVGLFHVSNDFKNSTEFASGAEEINGLKKQNIMGLLFSIRNGTWDAQVRQGLSGKTEINDVTGSTIAGVTNGTDIEFNSTSSTKLSGGYKMDTMYFYGAYEMGAAEYKVDSAKQSETEASTMTLGAINSHKKDGVDFFYGVSAIMANSKEKVGDTKSEATYFPVIFGVEAEASSWLTLRGSLTQNFALLSSVKPDGGKAASVTDSTTTRLGAGFKWGKADIDAVLGTGTSGTFGLDDDGNNFAQMSVTYSF